MDVRQNVATIDLSRFFQQLAKIFDHGKNHGTNLIRKFKRKVLPLLKIQCKFIVNWDTTTTNTFVSKKDKTPKKSLSSVVYKFSCPGCSHSYIGKTDRCLYTRFKEHTTSTDSEIFKHINSCEHFSYLTNMLTLILTNHNLT